MTVSDWPEGSPLDIIDFMAFGRPAGHLPAAMATPAYYELSPDRSVAGRQYIRIRRKIKALPEEAGAANIFPIYGQI